MLIEKLKYGLFAEAYPGICPGDGLRIFFLLWGRGLALVGARKFPETRLFH